MTSDVAIPISTPSATLEWWDFVAAEAGSDFYFVQVSTDGGATWPYEVLRDSVDEEFWDYESADMTAFIGQSVRVRFGFSSDDTITNLGWYLDDVRIVGEGLGEGVSAVAISDGSLTEGSATLTMPFELAIDPANDREITLEYVTVSGSAQAGLDFVSSSGLLTIPIGAASTTINVPIVDDVLFEYDEMFQLIISNPSDNAVITIAAAEGTILDNEELECLYDEDFEPQGGTFRWSVPHPVDPFGTGRDEAELWHVIDSTPCFGDGAGYFSPTHALVFTDESTCSYDTLEGIEGWVEMTQDIPIIDQVSGLADDVLAAQLSFMHYLEIAYAAESEDRTEAYVEISADGGQNWDTLHTFRADVPSSETYVIPQVEEVISLDKYIGNNVRIRFRFRQPVEPERHSAAGWLIDDVRICYASRPEGISKITVVSAEEQEGNYGTSPLEFDVTIFPDPATVAPEHRQVKVISFGTVELDEPDAAAAEVDYVSTAGQLEIPGDAASATITVLMTGDDLSEDDERFGLVLDSVSSNVFLVNTQVTGTILDDDVPSTLDASVRDSSPSTKTVNEGDGTVFFEVELSAARSEEIYVDFVTVDDTAFSGAGLDYSPASGTLHFPANTTTATMSVTILDDANYEGDVSEQFYIEFTTESPLAEDGSVPIQIEDNDPDPEASGGEPTATLNIQQVPGEEIDVQEGSYPLVSAPEPPGSLYEATFVVTLSESNGTFDTTVDYACIDGTAVAGEDYEDVSDTLVIAAGETSASFTVSILADRRVEGEEYFEVVLSSPEVVGDPDATVNVETNRQRCIIHDDDYIGTAFGSNDMYVTSRELTEQTEYGIPLAAGTLNLKAAEFRGYEFDTLYGWDEDDTLKSINMATGEVSDIPVSEAGHNWTGLAWDHTNGKAFALTWLGDLMEIDLTDGTVTSLPATLPDNTSLYYASAAVHPSSGRIYVVGVDTDTLETYLYEVIQGEWTYRLVDTLLGLTSGNTNVGPFWDCDFDDSTGELYLNAYGGGGGDAASSADSAVAAAGAAVTANTNAVTARAGANVAAANAPLYAFLYDCINARDGATAAGNATNTAAAHTNAAADYAAPNAPDEAEAARSAAAAAAAAGAESLNASHRAHDALMDAYYKAFVYYDIFYFWCDQCK